MRLLESLTYLGEEFKSLEKTEHQLLPRPDGQDELVVRSARRIAYFLCMQSNFKKLLLAEAWLHDALQRWPLVILITCIGDAANSRKPLCGEFEEESVVSA